MFARLALVLGLGAPTAKAVVPEHFFDINADWIHGLGWPQGLRLDGPRCLPEGGTRLDRGDAARIAVHATRHGNLPHTIAFAILLKERLGYSPVLVSPAGGDLNQLGAMYFLNGCSSEGEAFERYRSSDESSFCAMTGPVDVSLEVMDNGGYLSNGGSIGLDTDAVKNGTHLGSTMLSSQMGLYTLPGVVEENVILDWNSEYSPIEQRGQAVQAASTLPVKETSAHVQAVCSDPESDIYRRLYDIFGYGCEPDGTFVPAFCHPDRYSTQGWGWWTWMDMGVECVPLYVDAAMLTLGTVETIVELFNLPFVIYYVDNLMDIITESIWFKRPCFVLSFDKAMNNVDGMVRLSNPRTDQDFSRLPSYKVGRRRPHACPHLRTHARPQARTHARLPASLPTGLALSSADRPLAPSHARVYAAGDAASHSQRRGVRGCVAFIRQLGHLHR